MIASRFARPLRGRTVRVMRRCSSVIEGLAAYVRGQGLASIRDVVGVALPKAE